MSHSQAKAAGKRCYYRSYWRGGVMLGNTFYHALSIFALPWYSLGSQECVGSDPGLGECSWGRTLERGGSSGPKKRLKKGKSTTVSA